MKASIIVVANPAPRSGKTTVVEVLARDLAEAEHQVLAIDADPKATLTDNLERLIIEGSLADVLGRTLPITEVIHATPYRFELVPSFSDLSDWVDDISTNQFKRAIAPARDRYDYILIDTPSAINTLALSIINCADAILAPVHHRIRRPTPIDRHHGAFIPKKKNKRLNDLYDFVSDDLFFRPSSLLW